MRRNSQIEISSYGRLLEADLTIGERTCDGLGGQVNVQGIENDQGQRYVVAANSFRVESSIGGVPNAWDIDEMVAFSGVLHTVRRIHVAGLPMVALEFSKSWLLPKNINPRVEPFLDNEGKIAGMVSFTPDFFSGAVILSSVSGLTQAVLEDV